MKGRKEQQGEGEGNGKGKGKGSSRSKGRCDRITQTDVITTYYYVVCPVNHFFCLVPLWLALERHASYQDIALLTSASLSVQSDARRRVNKNPA